MKRFERILLIVSVSSALIGPPGCGPNREQWMARAAKDQAAVATEDMGKPDEVRLGAKAETTFLNGITTAIYGNLDKYSTQERAVYIPLAQSATSVASGLQAIAGSQTDTGFTTAVLAMCDSDRRAAEPRVGQLELAMAGALQAGKLQPNAPPQQRAEAAATLTTFGNTMVSIPARCDQAEAQLAEASVQEQQAETQHQANVSRALTAAAIVFAGTALVAAKSEQPQLQDRLWCSRTITTTRNSRHNNIGNAKRVLHRGSDTSC